MNITYLVDLENIGSKPLYKYIEEHQDGEYIIFYSDNTSSPATMLDELPDMLNVSFVYCKTGSNNAMDFCICAVAGKISAYRTKKMKILSNDKGYEPMVHMLQEQGIRITREDITYQPDIVPVKPLCDMDMGAIEDVIIKNVPNKYQRDMLKTIPKVISRKEAHEICQVILPKSLATEIYRKLRKHIPKEVI